MSLKTKINLQPPNNKLSNSSNLGSHGITFLGFLYASAIGLIFSSVSNGYSSGFSLVVNIFFALSLGIDWLIRFFTWTILEKRKYSDKIAYYRLVNSNFLLLLIYLICLTIAFFISIQNDIPTVEVPILFFIAFLYSWLWTGFVGHRIKHKKFLNNSNIFSDLSSAIKYNLQKARLSYSRKLHLDNDIQCNYGIDGKNKIENIFINLNGFILFILKLLVTFFLLLQSILIFYNLEFIPYKLTISITIGMIVIQFVMNIFTFFIMPKILDSIDKNHHNF